MVKKNPFSGLSLSKSCLTDNKNTMAFPSLLPRLDNPIRDGVLFCFFFARNIYPFEPKRV